MGKRIREECPEGVDIFFDNVGGEILDSALMNMARGGRIVLCGGISGYNAESPPPGPSNYMQLVIRRCTMQGFIVIDYFGRMAEAIGDLSDWIAEGAIVAEVDVVEGFERAPACLIRLFHGQNRGKQLCRIAEA